MSIAKTTAFDNKIIDGIMVCGEDGCTRMFVLAGTQLALQQTDSQVGDHELVLGSWSIGIHRVPGRQGSIYHLEIEAEETCKKSLEICVIPRVKASQVCEKNISEILTDHDENINHVSLLVY